MQLWYLLMLWCGANCAEIPSRAPSSKVHDGTVAHDAFSLRQSFGHGPNNTGLVLIQHDFKNVLAIDNHDAPQALTLKSRMEFNPSNIRLDTSGQQILRDGMLGDDGSAILWPNVTDKETVVNLAKMTSNSYYEDPSLSGWLNLSAGFNRSQSFGWETDSLRGHVFANSDNSTVVISFKGTTVSFWERTSSHDRENDNILFSCCCATQRKDPYPYGRVCDCRNATYSCNDTCLTQEVARTDRYYAQAINVVLNVTAVYPKSQLWVVGHSLGGALASLVGMTFNAPAVAFESPPDLLPAQRLGLALPPAKRSTTYHFGNSADPIFAAACNGYTASCSLAGFAFESQCFSGRRCEYDTVTDKGWRVNVLNHRIDYVIENVLKAYDTVANCTTDDECIDCYLWNFYD